MRTWAVNLRDRSTTAPTAWSTDWRARSTGVFTWLIGSLWFFRDPVFTGFDTITGDRGDARLVIFLHEHWWRVWRGEASWRSPEMFAPADGTLGYSDTFILNQVLYAPLRFVGFDQFVAFQLTLIGLTGIGFASLFTLMHRYLRLALLPTCLLASAAVFANNVYVDTGHPQLYSINIVCLIALVAVAAWHATTSRWRTIGSAAAGFLTAFLLWSTYYFGWFTLFFGVLVVVLTGAIAVVAGDADDIVATIRDRWTMAASTLGGLAIGLVPFLATYLPVLDDTERRSYEEVAILAPRPLDLVNVGRHNVMWGWLVRPLLDGDQRLDQLNRAVAPTPTLLAFAAVATVALAMLVRRRRAGVARVGLAVGVSALVAVVMPIQFGVGGLWAWAHRLVPGATALRVFARVEVVAALLLCLTIACWLRARRDRSDDVSEADPAADRIDRARVGPIVGVVLAVICVEQLNTATAFRQFDRSDELALLEATPPPPDECDVFYVTDADRLVTDHTLISAMLIAHSIDVPTLNGYSGQRPPGWHLLPWEDDYANSVDRWVEKRRIAGGVCALETTTLEWSVPGDR